MLESFGARLRRRREEQDIALLTIAERTKIKLSLLEALERDDVSHWPSGIFRRSFFRAYAQAIGLDPDAALREFLETHFDPAEIVSAMPAAVPAADGTQTSGGPPTRLRYIVDSAWSRLWGRPSAVDEVVAEASPLDVPVPDRFDLPVAARPSPEPDKPVEITKEAVIDPMPAKVVEPSDPDFAAVARLCTEFARVGSTNDVQPLLKEAARILDAIGLIVWVWDALAAELRPALAHGYSARVLAKLPTVRRDAENVTAAAFRSAETFAISGSEQTRGALVVPLLTPGGCAGVLAIELPSGSEQIRSVRAFATIFAALLARLIGGLDPDRWISGHSTPLPQHA